MNTLKQGFKGIHTVSHATTVEWKHTEEKYEALLAEIKLIQAEIDDAKKVLGASAGQNGASSTQGDGQMRTAIDQVTGVLKELQAMADLCGVKSSSGEAKVNKPSWFVYEKRIPPLYEKSEKLKGNLRAARVAYLAKQNGDLMASMSAIEKAVASSQPEITNTMDMLRQFIENNPLIDALPKIQKLLESGPAKNPRPIQTAKEEEEDTLIKRVTIQTVDGEIAVWEEKPQGQAIGKKNLPLSGGILEYRGQPVDHRWPPCPNSCLCKCHTQPWRFGDRTVNEKPGSVFGCICRVDDLFSGEDESSPELADTSGFGRVIPMVHEIWHYARESATSFNGMLQNGITVFPDDQRDDGVSLLELLLATRRFSILELLLNKWEEEGVLSGKKLPRRLGYAIRLFWDSKPFEVESSFLKRLGTYVDGWDEPYPKLHGAVISGSKADVQKALEDLNNPVDINELGSIGLAPIHLTAMLGQVEIMQLLMDAGADINCRDFNGGAPLKTAVYWNNLECAQSLLKANCRVDDQSDDGLTALDHAAAYSDMETVRLLLQHGASRSANVWKATPLHLATRARWHDSKELIQVIIDEKASDVDSRDNWGLTPLEWALKANNFEMMRGLIEAGASLKFGENQNILHYAAGYCGEESLDFLIGLELSAKDGIDVELCDDWGETPWERFISCCHCHLRHLGDFRVPGKYIGAAFIALFQSIRDRNLQNDIEELQNALDALNARDIETSCSYLSGLSRQKKRCNRDDLAGWYGKVRVMIRAGERNSAVAKMENYLQVLRNKLDTSIWSAPSRWSVQGFLKEMFYNRTRLAPEVYSDDEFA